MHNNFQGDGSELIFIDEISKDEQTWAHHYGQAMSGTRAHFADVFVRGDQYSLVAAMAVDGYIAVSYPYFSQSQLWSNLGLPVLSLGIDTTPDLVWPSPAP